MSKLEIQYSRRIIKKLPPNTEPIPSIPGTNHIDNFELWSDNTIYAGELAIDLERGKLFSSDGENIINFYKDKQILQGLQVLPPKYVKEGGNSIIAPLNLQVTSGIALINGKKYIHISDESNGDLIVMPTGLLPRYDLIYATTSIEKYYLSDPYFKLKLIIINGPNTIEELKRNIYLPANYDENKLIFLGIVYIPPNYNYNSHPHQLRPISWSVSNNYEERIINIIETQSFPINNINNIDLVNKILTNIYKHHEPNYSNQNLKFRDTRTYLEGQIIEFNNNLYKVVETHFCESIYTSISQNKIIKLTNVSPSGNFNLFRNILDRKLSVSNNLLENQNYQPTGLKILHNVFNNTFVSVKVNGIECYIGNGNRDDCNCYFSNDNGLTAKTYDNLEKNDELFWNAGFSNYTLVTNDIISFDYLINI